jgi:starch synthase
MMNVIHLSAECYPVAKAGGLGDVVGALPKYLCKKGVRASVVLPYYDRKFVRENTFESVFEGKGQLGHRVFDFNILKETTNKLGFELFLVYIPGLLDRPEIYAYPDEREQFVAYQLAFLEWLVQSGIKPDLIHCHDHHSGLIPFLVSHSYRYNCLKHIPTVCTVHNGEYQGWLGWDKVSYLPEIDLSRAGLLDWSGCINSLAAAIKCCWKFTTVSPSYLKELSQHSNGLESLFLMERQKGFGIINGIDTEIWNPETDPLIKEHYTIETVSRGKPANKKLLCKEFGLSDSSPLIVFIGRLVGEKGADLLPAIVDQMCKQYKNKVNILILGSGESEIEGELRLLLSKHKKQFGLFIGYDEELAHRIYAGADFILMPSRVEPCGLNQLYALKYGTMPVVNSTGGLKDTIIDLKLEEGYGIKFNGATVPEACEGLNRAVRLYADSQALTQLQERMMALDFSWDRSATQYIDLYKSLTSL